MWHLVDIHAPFLSPMMWVWVQKWLFQGVSKQYWFGAFALCAGWAKICRSTFKNQLWILVTSSNLTRYHLLVLLWVSKLRTALLKHYLEHHTTLSSIYQCHCEKGPSSKIVFLEPYKQAFCKNFPTLCRRAFFLHPTSLPNFLPLPHPHNISPPKHALSQCINPPPPTCLI